MTRLPSTFLVRENNFANAWARSVQFVLREGVREVIGSTIEPKGILDTCMLIELRGDALREVERKEIHPQFPFKHISQYCEEFSREYLAEYIEKPWRKQFSYLYFERLAMYGDSPGRLRDQITALRKDLKVQMDTGILSNRNQAITWMPYIDIGNAAAPCLQRIWIKYLGDRDVEVHLTWRSRDLYTAWQANIIAIIDMLNREVIEPNMCWIKKIVDYTDSMHIYQSDVPAASEVKLVPVSPR